MAMRGYVHIYQDSLMELIKCKENTGEVFRVWGYLMCKVKFLNKSTPSTVTHVPIDIATQEQIAKELGIDPARVSHAIKILVKQGIFEKKRQGHSVNIRLSRKFGWRGTSDLQQEFMESQ
ncbi:MAG: hypothetical protein IPL99_24715 [Candidatus Competibacteraceae bacterium]|nr:hypothetical protein [Candidatus Competibacteraceae bacterium]